MVAQGEVAENPVKEVLGVGLQAAAMEREGHPAAGPEKPDRVLEARQRIDKVGERLAIGDQVEAIGTEDHVLGRHRHEGGVGPSLGPGQIKHPGAEVDPNHASPGSDPAGQQVGDEARTAPDVENDLSAGGCRHLDQPGGDLAVKTGRPGIVFGGDPVVILDEMLDQLLGTGKLHRRR